MPIMDGLNEEVYEEMQVRIAYYKLFPLIVKDFLTRADAKEMMKSSNLVATVNPGIAVTTAGGPTAQSGSTVSPGKAQVNAVYKGEVPLAKSKQLELTYKRLKDTGDVAGKALGELPG